MPAAIEKNKTVLQTVEEEKNELAIKLLSLKDKAVVHAFKLIFDDLTATTKKTTKARYNKEIDAAVKRAHSGKSASSDEVMSEMDTW